MEKIYFESYKTYKQNATPDLQCETHHHHDEDEDTRSVTNSSISNFTQCDVKDLQRALNAKRDDTNEIHVHRQQSLALDAMVRPDIYRNVAFPSLYSIPGIPIHKIETLPLKTNANGVCWVQVNFGQFLTYYSALVTQPNTPSAGNTTYTFPKSNVYLSNSEITTAGFFDGALIVDQYAPITNGTCVPSNVLEEQGDMYNAVRAGPAAVWFDFTGRIDISSGTVTAGINYTFSNVVNADVTTSSPNFNRYVTPDEGFKPDFSYVTQRQIQDCPYSYEGSIMDSFSACFIPQDERALDLRLPDKGNQNVQQRLFILVTGAAPSAVIGQLKIATNFDGKATPKFADTLASEVLETPTQEKLSEATDWLISTGNVIRKTRDQGYGVSRFDNKFS
jgi:hypothetical protein